MFVVEIGEIAAAGAEWEEAEASLKFKAYPDKACVPIHSQTARVAQVVGVQRLDVIVAVLTP